MAGQIRLPSTTSAAGNSVLDHWLSDPSHRSSPSSTQAQSPTTTSTSASRTRSARPANGRWPWPSSTAGPCTAANATHAANADHPAARSQRTRTGSAPRPARLAMSRAKSGGSAAISAAPKRCTPGGDARFGPRQVRGEHHHRDQGHAPHRQQHGEGPGRWQHAPGAGQEPCAGCREPARRQGQDGARHGPDRFADHLVHRVDVADQQQASPGRRAQAQAQLDVAIASSVTRLCSSAVPRVDEDRRRRVMRREGPHQG